MNLNGIRAIKIIPKNANMMFFLYKEKYPSLSHIRISEDILNVLYVNTKNNEPIGFYSIDLPRNMILAIDVNKKYRKRGYGEYMLTKAISNGGWNLTVRKTNSIAIKMYKKNGFKICDETEYQYIMRLHK